MHYQRDIVNLQAEEDSHAKSLSWFFKFKSTWNQGYIFSLPQWRQYFTPGTIFKVWFHEPLRKPVFENNDNYNILIPVRILYISAAKIWKIIVHIFKSHNLKTL